MRKLLETIISAKNITADTTSRWQQEEKRFPALLERICILIGTFPLFMTSTGHKLEREEMIIVSKYI